MSCKLIITPAFERDAKPLMKKYKSLKTDLAVLFESIENNSTQGKSLGKDCFKIRMSITSKGKSGGARVITCYKKIYENIFLLAIYDKSEKETLSDKELNELLESI